MSKLGEFSERALVLIEQAGEKLQIGGDKAGNLIKTGAALGVARTGAKTAVAFAKRNPAVAITAGIGVGLLALAAYRRRKRAQMLGSTEGTPRRIDARRVEGTGKPSRKLAEIDDDTHFV
ncbi:MAG: hypothetical protein QM769_05820 [Pseudoxanthomonas sp.]